MIENRINASDSSTELSPVSPSLEDPWDFYDEYSSIDAQSEFLTALFAYHLPMSSLHEQGRMKSLAHVLYKFRPSAAAGAAFLQKLKIDLENWMFGTQGINNPEYLLSRVLIEADYVHSTELEENEVLRT